MNWKKVFDFSLATLVVLFLIAVIHIYDAISFEEPLFPILFNVIVITALVIHLQHLRKLNTLIQSGGDRVKQLVLVPRIIYFCFLVYFLMFLEIIVSTSIIAFSSAQLNWYTGLVHWIHTLGVISICYLSYCLINVKLIQTDSIEKDKVKNNTFDIALFIGLTIISLLAIPIIEFSHISISFGLEFSIYLGIVYIPLVIIETIRYKNPIFTISLIVVAVVVMPILFHFVRSVSSGINFTILVFLFFFLLINLAVIFIGTKNAIAKPS